MLGRFISDQKCGPHHETLTSQFKIEAVQQTNYYFTESSVITNYSDIETISKRRDACLSDCQCIASIYGLNEENAYCWVLRSLECGGYEDADSTLFVKVESNGSSTMKSDTRSVIERKKVLVVPIVLSMAFLIGLLCCLLDIYVHKKRYLKRALENSLIVSGAPISFSYQDFQYRTSNFSHLLGTGNKRNKESKRKGVLGTFTEGIKT